MLFSSFWHPSLNPLSHWFALKKAQIKSVTQKAKEIVKYCHQKLKTVEQNTIIIFLPAALSERRTPSCADVSRWCFPSLSIVTKLSQVCPFPVVWRPLMSIFCCGIVLIVIRLLQEFGFLSQLTRLLINF